MVPLHEPARTSWYLWSGTSVRQALRCLHEDPHPQHQQLHDLAASYKAAPSAPSTAATAHDHAARPRALPALPRDNDGGPPSPLYGRGGPRQPSVAAMAVEPFAPPPLSPSTVAAAAVTSTKLAVDASTAWGGSSRVRSPRVRDGGDGGSSGGDGGGRVQSLAGRLLGGLLRSPHRRPLALRQPPPSAVLLTNPLGVEDSLHSSTACSTPNAAAAAQRLPSYHVQSPSGWVQEQQQQSLEAGANASSLVQIQGESPHWASAASARKLKVQQETPEWLQGVRRQAADGGRALLDAPSPGTSALGSGLTGPVPLPVPVRLSPDASGPVGNDDRGASAALLADQRAVQQPLDGPRQRPLGARSRLAVGSTGGAAPQDSGTTAEQSPSEDFHVPAAPPVPASASGASTPMHKGLLPPMPAPPPAPLPPPPPPAPLPPPVVRVVSHGRRALLSGDAGGPSGPHLEVPTAPGPEGASEGPVVVGLPAPGRAVSFGRRAGSGRSEAESSVSGSEAADAGLGDALTGGVAASGASAAPSGSSSGGRVVLHGRRASGSGESGQGPTMPSIQEAEGQSDTGAPAAIQPPALPAMAPPLPLARVPSIRTTSSKTAALPPRPPLGRSISAAAGATVTPAAHLPAGTSGPGLQQTLQQREADRRTRRTTSLPVQGRTADPEPSPAHTHGGASPEAGRAADDEASGRRSSPKLAFEQQDQPGTGDAGPSRLASRTPSLAPSLHDMPAPSRRSPSGSGPLAPVRPLPQSPQAPLLVVLPPPAPGQSRAATPHLTAKPPAPQPRSPASTTNAPSQPREHTATAPQSPAPHNSPPSPSPHSHHAGLTPRSAAAAAELAASPPEPQRPSTDQQQKGSADPQEAEGHEQSPLPGATYAAASNKSTATGSLQGLQQHAAPEPGPEPEAHTTDTLQTPTSAPASRTDRGVAGGPGGHVDHGSGAPAGASHTPAPPDGGPDSRPSIGNAPDHQVHTSWRAGGSSRRSSRSSISEERTTASTIATTVTWHRPPSIRVKPEQGAKASEQGLKASEKVQDRVLGGGSTQRLLRVSSSCYGDGPGPVGPAAAADAGRPAGLAQGAVSKVGGKVGGSEFLAAARAIELHERLGLLFEGARGPRLAVVMQVGT